MPLFLGKGQLAECMRSGVKCYASELVRDGRNPQLLVLPRYADPAHPQERPFKPDDAEGRARFPIAPDHGEDTPPVLSGNQEDITLEITLGSHAGVIQYADIGEYFPLGPFGLISPDPGVLGDVSLGLFLKGFEDQTGTETFNYQFIAADFSVGEVFQVGYDNTGSPVGATIPSPSLFAGYRIDALANSLGAGSGQISFALTGTGLTPAPADDVFLSIAIGTDNGQATFDIANIDATFSIDQTRLWFWIEGSGVPVLTGGNTYDLSVTQQTTVSTPYLQFAFVADDAMPGSGAWNYITFLDDNFTQITVLRSDTTDLGVSGFRRNWRSSALDAGLSAGETYAVHISRGIIVEWTQASTVGPRVDGYKLYRAQGAGPFVLLYTLPVVFSPAPNYAETHPLSTVDRTVAPGTVYRYRVDAMTADDRVLASNDLQLTYELPDLAVSVSTSRRLLEDGSFRLLEDGGFRNLESAP